MKSVLSTILVLVMAFGLCACGSSDHAETAAATQPAETAAVTQPAETAAPTAAAEEMAPCGNDVMAREEAEKETAQTAPTYNPVDVSSYDDIDKIYTFQLEGSTYSLPCTVSEFLDNGCTMSEHSLTTTIPAQRVMGQLRVYPTGNEDSYIELSVLNDTDSDRTVQECDKVVGITIRDDSNVSLILSTGIDIGSGTVDLETMHNAYFSFRPVYRTVGESMYIWEFYKLINDDYDGAFVLGLAPGMDRLTVDDGKISLEYAGRP